jgi:hypothetical protein
MQEGSGETAFAQAYRAARRFAERAGAGGERLLVGDVVQATGLSPTPVREALSRLVGENIIEEHRGGGYFIPRPAARDITELYILTRALGLAATTHLSGTFGSVRACESLPHEADTAPIAIWFSRLATRSGNEALQLEVYRLNGRMVRIRRVEQAAFAKDTLLFAEASSLTDSEDVGLLTSWVDRYARAGIDAAGDIADLLARRHGRI